MRKLRDLQHLSPQRFEAPLILKKVATAGRKLAELKGIAASIPNQGILINTLGMQQAKDSSAIENIVTTHDELFKDDAFPESSASPAAKEVLRYRQALRFGFELVRDTGLLTLNHILRIQGELEANQAGFRKVPGTVLKDSAGHTIYTPPQDAGEIATLMTGLERFLNEPDEFDADPLIKMALIHHQFESIHPFYDGNGRTGRILNVLYLVAIEAIRMALLNAKHRIRAQYKFYSQDLLNNLFTHPYTKIDFVMRDLKITRLTATKYLSALVHGGFLEKKKMGRTLYFINPL